MVDVEVVFGGFVDVDFEVGDVVFYFDRDNEIVCGEDLEFFSFIIGSGVLLDCYSVLGSRCLRL